MSDQIPGALPTAPRRRRGTLTAVALLAGGAVAGGIAMSTVSASAAGTPTSTAVPSAQSYQSAQQQGPGQGPPGGGMEAHGSAPVRSDEKALSTADAAKVKAAALKAVPGGTVYRVETDAGDAAYEAHVTKADGTDVTVKLDKNFTVTKVENGMGLGDPQPNGASAGSQSGSPGA